MKKTNKQKNPKYKMHISQIQEVAVIVSLMHKSTWVESVCCNQAGVFFEVEKEILKVLIKA